MAHPPKDPDKLPEQEADARFNKLVGNLVKTPHRPHKASPDGASSHKEKPRKI
jgi:hypothetical protein